MSGFDEQTLRELPLVAELELHTELGSTNDRAKKLAPASGDLPLLIVADRQTAGRGRGDHAWHASAGSLTFSLLLDPASHRLGLSKQGLLSLATALAVIDAVKATTGLTASLKWPNDVLVGRKKLAGILIESPRPDRWIVGVGINVNNRFDDAAQEVADRAASLGGLAASEVSRQELLVEFLQAFNVRLAELASDKPALLNAARQACVLTGNAITLLDGDRTVSGTCCGLDDAGRLRIETESGLVACSAGSIVEW